LKEKDCGIYGGRPITCALFPEAFFLFPGHRRSLDKDTFCHYPCLREPPVISEKRRSHLTELMEMARREAFLTEFYLFGFSPLCLDLRNKVTDVLEVSQNIRGSSRENERPYEVPHEAFEKILAQGLSKGGYLAEIDPKVDRLSSPSGIEALHGIKEWTDSIATTHEDFPYCYEFDARDRLSLVKRQI
jgi:hypothetical protein